MYNVLLSDFSIDNERAYQNLKEVIEPLSKVLVLPYSNWEYIQDEKHYENLYDYHDGDEFNDYYRKLHMYGIQKKDISVISPKDSVEFILSKIRKADIILLSGGDPNQFVKYTPKEVWWELDYKEKIIGISAGSMVQCNFYYMYKDYKDDTVPFVEKDKYYWGMGFVWETIIVHYDGNELQQQAIKNNEKRKFKPLKLIRDGGGLMYYGGYQIGEW